MFNGENIFVEDLLIVQDSLQNSWKIGSEIGKGSFGVIFSG
jgi:hypothetical protein